MSQEQSVSRLLAVGRRVGDRAILVPTTDLTAVLVAERASALQDWFVFPRLSPGLVRSLVNKREMHALAELHGIPTAKTVFIRTKDDVLAFLDHAVLPIIVKGVDPLMRKGTLKVVVHTRSHLLEYFQRVTDSNLMLQEYIPGSDGAGWMFNGYFNQQSDCLVGFTGRKLRQYPAYAGVTSLGVCETNEWVEHTTKAFMKTLGYHGILDVDYCYDARDGRYKLLDVNPRVGATFRLGVAEGGMDIIRSFYHDMSGRPASPPVALEGRKWMLEEDVLSSLRAARDGKLTFRGWVKSLRGVQETAWFARDDLIPFLVWFWRYLIKPLTPVRSEGTHRVLPDVGLGKTPQGSPSAMPDQVRFRQR